MSIRIRTRIVTTTLFVNAGVLSVMIGERHNFTLALHRTVPMLLQQIRTFLMLARVLLMLSSVLAKAAPLYVRHTAPGCNSSHGMKAFLHQDSSDRTSQRCSEA